MPAIASLADTPAMPDQPRPESLAQLFWAFTWLALQGFGGVLAVVQRVLVERKRWLTLEQFMEDWAVAQVLPGPNVINMAMMIGDRYFSRSLTNKMIADPVFTSYQNRSYMIYIGILAG